MKMIKKEDTTPFKVGSLISNGKKIMVVNSIFKLKDDWKMLIADYLWLENKYCCKYATEAFCKDWYLAE